MAAAEKPSGLGNSQKTFYNTNKWPPHPVQGVPSGCGLAYIGFCRASAIQCQQNHTDHPVHISIPGDPLGSGYRSMSPSTILMLSDDDARHRKKMMTKQIHFMALFNFCPHGNLVPSSVRTRELCRFLILRNTNEAVKHETSTSDSHWRQFAITLRSRNVYLGFPLTEIGYHALGKTTALLLLSPHKGNQTERNQFLRGVDSK